MIRQFTPEDYKQYASWWKPNNPPARQDLPTIGLVVEDMKAVGFLALTDCSFGIITFWMPNPKNTPKETKETLLELFKALVDAGLIMKKNKIFIYTQIPSIIRLLKSIHFRNNDGHLIWEAL